MFHINLHCLVLMPAKYHEFVILKNIFKLNTDAFSTFFCHQTPKALLLYCRWNPSLTSTPGKKTWHTQNCDCGSTRISQRGKKKRNTCIIQLYLIWDQLLSPLPLLVSRRRNGTCQNKGSEIRLEQSWAGHLGGRLSISHSACCLLHSHSPLRNCVRKCNCVWNCVRVRVCVCETPHSLPTTRHQDLVTDQPMQCRCGDTPPGQPPQLTDKYINW